MLPAFPDFADVSAGSCLEARRLVARLPSYADFSMVFLHCYAAELRIGLAEHRTNLVVRFTDRRTNSPTCSFAGHGPAAETARVLLASLRGAGHLPELCLIPKEAAMQLGAGCFVVEPDPAHFEYLLDVEQIAAFEGRKFKQRRNHVNRFRARSAAQAVPLDLSDATMHGAVLRLCGEWRAHKAQRCPPAMSVFGEDDLGPIAHFLLLAHTLPHVALGLFDGRELIAFAICELTEGGSAIAHFVKANTWTFPGAFDAMMQETARALLARGCLRLNIQEDLGSPSLRFFKRSYRPVALLEKYRVREREAISLSKPVQVLAGEG